MWENFFVTTEREAWLAWHGAGSGALRERNSFLNSAPWAGIDSWSSQHCAWPLISKGRGSRGGCPGFSGALSPSGLANGFFSHRVKVYSRTMVELGFQARIVYISHHSLVP